MEVLIKCAGSRMAKLGDMKPLQGELKKLTEENYRKLKKEIVELGFSAPFFCWTSINGERKDEIDLLDGHQRHKALNRMQDEGITLPEEFPIVDVDALSHTQARKKILAITSNYGTMTFGGLKSFMEESEIDVSEITESFTFDAIDFNDFNVDVPDLPIEQRELTEEGKEQLSRAWEEWCGEVLETIDLLKELKIFSQSYNKSYLKIAFINAFYTDKTISRSATLGYQYHRMLCSGDGKNGGSIYQLLYAVNSEEVKSERIRFALQEKPSIEKLMTVSGVAMSGHKAPLDFPVDLARDLYNEFGNKGKILDPCHGWGGRYLGFGLSDCESYTGVDASDLTSRGLVEMHRDLSPIHNKKANFICSPFEDTQHVMNQYDFALTSPPYFDREEYLGGDQAHDRYKTYEEFIDGFYTDLIQITFDALKEDGYFALQVGNQAYDLDKQAKKIAEKVGFKLFESRNSKMSKVGASEEDEIKEVILIFKKEL